MTKLKHIQIFADEDLAVQLTGTAILKTVFNSGVAGAKEDPAAVDQITETFADCVGYEEDGVTPKQTWPTELEEYAASYRGSGYKWLPTRAYESSHLIPFDSIINGTKVSQKNNEGMVVEFSSWSVPFLILVFVHYVGERSLRRKL